MCSYTCYCEYCDKMTDKTHACIIHSTLLLISKFLPQTRGQTSGLILRMRIRAWIQIRIYPQTCREANRNINETVQHFILYLVIGRPGIYLREIVSELSAVLGLDQSDVTESAVCKFLKKVGFTHHK